MTLNTRVHIAKPVNPESLFLRILGILESDPEFTPAWESQTNGPFGRVEPGPLRLGRATYKHVRKGDILYRPDGTVVCHRTTGEPFAEDESEYHTTLGQGLAAIWTVTYGSDGPLLWPPDDPDEPEDEGPPLRSHAVSANFDTAYGYRANGAKCTDLHAFLLREIKRYLDEAGIEEWVWLHEEHGSWHLPAEYPLRGNADLAAANFPGGAS